VDEIPLLEIWEATQKPFKFGVVFLALKEEGRDKLLDDNLCKFIRSGSNALGSLIT
jgi:hypothetical protein